MFNIVDYQSKELRAPELKKGAKMTGLAQVYALGMILHQIMQTVSQRGIIATGVPVFLDKVITSMINPDLRKRPTFKAILGERMVKQLRKLTDEEKFVWQLPEHFKDTTLQEETKNNSFYGGLESRPKSKQSSPQRKTYYSRFARQQG